MIEIRKGILSSFSQDQIDALAALGSKIAIITDDQVAPLYGKPFQDTLLKHGLNVHLFVFPHGEQSKTRATKEALENQLLEKNFGRDSCLIALGGGVATDLGGYVAATYCRGIPLIMAPTSLLGMVDASIGGKTGVNTPYGKNMIGCIYQPKKIWIDPLTLRSLPKKELSCGIVETIKHGLIADASFFDYLEEHVEDVRLLHDAILEKVILKSCQIKQAIVTQDERENGMRRLLNFGHTIGHALEHITNYSLSHGEAVAMGILAESKLSMELGLLSQPSYDRIKHLLMRYGLSLKLPQTSIQDILNAMMYDKKSLKNQPRYVLLEEIGSPAFVHADYCTHVDELLVKKTIGWIKHDLHCH